MSAARRKSSPRVVESSSERIRYSERTLLPEFMACQVVLVRNEQAKAALPREFKSALVMTVLDAKGLEFGIIELFICCNRLACTQMTSSSGISSLIRSRNR